MIIKSKNSNLYFLSKIKPQLLVINPILKSIIELNSKGIDTAGMMKEDLMKNVSNLSSSDSDQIEHNLAYYDFLKKRNYFDKQDFISLERIRNYTSDKVKIYLANTDQISFEVTDECNLNCKYCGYGELYEGHDERLNKKMDYNDAISLLENVINLKMSNLNIKTYRKIAISFYGGEPLLNFRFIKKIVTYTNSINIYPNEFHFQMTTNGVLLQKHIDFLVENNFLVSISLDGNYSNNGYRVFKNGRSSFAIITSNVEMIKEKYPEFFKNNIEFVSVLHSKNDPEEIEEYFKDKYGKLSRILPLADLNVKKNKESDYYKIKYQHPNKEMIDEFSPLNVVKFTNTFSGFVYSNIGSILSNKPKNKSVCTGTCNPFEKRIFLTVNGKILPCERISQQFALGYVKKGKVNLNYKKIAEQYNNFYAKLKNQCNSCERAEECMQCIFYLDLTKENPICKDYLNKKEFQERVEGILTALENDAELYLGKE